MATLGAVGVIGVLSAQQLPPPTFRSGVRLIEVDVEVRDKDDRFVETLTKDDFEVLEDGVPRQIQQVWAVNLASGRKTDPPASAATPVVPALVGSDANVGRLYVLVLGHGGEQAKAIARQFISDFLGPNDLMAVVPVADRAATQGLTSDREILLASVDRSRGGGSPEAALATLKEVAVSLNASTGRRKAVLFIGDGFNLWTPLVTPGAPLSGAPIDVGVAALKLSRLFDDVEKVAKRNNVRIYPIDIGGFHYRGLAGGGMDSDQVASLRILAADTHGIAIANTNNYDGNFKRIVRDNSAYYLLTYESMAEPDGQSHPITVRLHNQPRLSLEQGRLSVTAPPPDVKGRAARMPKTLSAEARTALALSTPAEGKPLQIFTAVYQGTNFSGSVLIGTHVPGTLLNLTPKETIELSYMAVDRWGVVRAVDRRAFTLNLGSESRARVERTGVRLFGRLQVPHGQYQIRVVAHQANGVTAAATTDVDVPDYADQPLTVSEFVVASSQGPALLTLEDDDMLRRALPSQPTPERRFAPNDSLTVFAEIYDSHWIVSQEVGVTMTVTASDGRLAFRQDHVLTTGDKGRFYLTGALQLDTFSPGDYQLLVEVNTRKGIPANASRAMHFAVRDAAALSLEGAKP
jgi:VWFA-related protein